MSNEAIDTKRISGENHDMKEPEVPPRESWQQKTRKALDEIGVPENCTGYRYLLFTVTEILEREKAVFIAEIIEDASKRWGESVASIEVQILQSMFWAKEYLTDPFLYFDNERKGIYQKYFESDMAKFSSITQFVDAIVNTVAKIE